MAVGRVYDGAVEVATRDDTRVGIDEVLIPVVGWHTPHEKTLESIRLLGEKVLPRFRKAR